MITRMKKALVTGALGVTGRAVVNYLTSLGDWEVIGVSRRRPEFQTTAKYLSVDLLNRSALEAPLSEINDITHIFFAALQPAANFFDEVAPNLAMLANTVEVVERASQSLRKVLLVEGAKFYGAHLGPYKTPAKETDPRHMPPNFYYDQEDYLVERSAGKMWSWTAFRPSSICGFAVGNPMNMATVIAVHASLCRELGLPFRFPGSTETYHAIMEMTDAELLAKAMVWAATNEECNGEAFNITKGDFDRWENLWPRIAQFFEMEYAPPQRLPLTLFMSDKEPVWNTLVKKHNLLNYTFSEAAAWPLCPIQPSHGDSVFTSGLRRRKCWCVFLHSSKRCASSHREGYPNSSLSN
jgi:nucleoside-diphosphate-sugar epimerase